MKVCVIGTGYVGLVTGTTFADLGNEVVCVDKIPEKIQMLNSGKMPIYEPGLEEMVKRNTEEGRLTFTEDLHQGVTGAKVVFIAVGTPPDETGATDLSFVEAAAKEIAAALEDYTIIVNKSTVPVGTGEFVRHVIEANRRRNVPFDVVSNPEFLKEGTAVKDSQNPERIVIGAPNQSVAMALLELYAPLEAPMLITDIASAEMIKYASNSFLATKISFINTIANICEKVGADVTQVAKGMGYDSRIGRDFLMAGLGYGGSCFPKDTLSLRHKAMECGECTDLFDAVIKTNETRVSRFLGRIEDRMVELKDKQIGILGLAFKPNTDDMREAKSVEFIKYLVGKGAKIKAYDPVATENCKKILPDIQYVRNAYETADGSDMLLIVTEWNEFKLLDFEKLRTLLKSPIIFDGRNIWTMDKPKRFGFEYYSIGR
ncbi:UDP-glucose/GDP-mannose dehydrogenase family protein [Candidatus Sumerlaeota bacterium]|nr:UDP-glucose/GDP-mannose dehydrogenase family protein [Candidatus Sumerlaeota bacterium]